MTKSQTIPIVDLPPDSSRVQPSWDTYQPLWHWSVASQPQRAVQPNHLHAECCCSSGWPSSSAAVRPSWGFFAVDFFGLKEVTCRVPDMLKLCQLVDERCRMVEPWKVSLSPNRNDRILQLLSIKHHRFSTKPKHTLQQHLPNQKSHKNHPPPATTRPQTKHRCPLADRKGPRLWRQRHALRAERWTPGDIADGEHHLPRRGEGDGEETAIPSAAAKRRRRRYGANGFPRKSKDEKTKNKRNDKCLFFSGKQLD